MPSATTRLALPYPLNADAVDVPGDIGALATALDNVVPYSQGVVGSRPVSTGGSPGIQGRRYYATDEGIEYLDTGSSWIVSARSAGSIAGTELANSAVTAGKLASDAVTTAKILNANVTDAKLASPNNHIWKCVHRASGVLLAADVTGSDRFTIHVDGKIKKYGTDTDTGADAFWLDPTAYVVAGKTLTWQVNASIQVGTTAPGFYINVGTVQVVPDTGAAAGKFQSGIPAGSYGIFGASFLSATLAADTINHATADPSFPNTTEPCMVAPHIIAGGAFTANGNVTITYSLEYCHV